MFLEIRKQFPNRMSIPHLHFKQEDYEIFTRETSRLFQLTTRTRNGKHEDLLSPLIEGESVIAAM